MRLERIEVQLVRLRFREPFRTAAGARYDRRVLLVKVAGNGARGYGECAATETPHASYETVETAEVMLRRHLIPGVLGQRFDSARELGPVLDTAARGHSMAKAALEMAVWDLEARLRGLPLARLLGGVKDAIPAGVSLGIEDNVDVLIEKIARFVDDGYRRVKVRVAPGWDVAVVARLRTRFPTLPLMIDACGAYAPAEADRLAALDGFGLMMLEQPFGEDELLAHAQLQQRLQMPICLDESITSPGRCRQALHLASCQTINIHPGRVGGHGAALRIHDLCLEAGIPVWCGGMVETGIGRAHNVALSSLPNFRLPGDTAASRRYWVRDVVSPEFELRSDGTLAVPTGPGIGVAVDEEFLASIEEDRVTFDMPGM